MLTRTPLRAVAGFSFFKVEEDVSKGFRTRFVYSEAKKSVFLHYANQVAPKRVGGGNADDEAASDARTFGNHLAIQMPVNTMVRLITTLESPTEPATFASREAQGRLEPLDVDSYTFRLTGKSSSTAKDVPSDFSVDIDAGNAVLLHRFLRASLGSAMGFGAPSEPAAASSGDNNRRNYNNRGDNNRGGDRSKRY